MIRFSPIVFMVVYCLAYLSVLSLHFPLFHYYPLGGDLTWGPVAMKGLGPAMAWYGLMASAAIVAGIAALFASDRLIERPLRNLLWLFPCAAILGSVYLMRVFFF